MKQRTTCLQWTSSSSFTTTCTIDACQLWVRTLFMPSPTWYNIIWYYTIIVFCWGQYELLWTFKTIFTEASRLRWISFLKSIKTRINRYKRLKLFYYKVKVKPSQYEINHFIMTSYIMQLKVKVKASQYNFNQTISNFTECQVTAW